MLYEYVCKRCDREFVEEQKMSDPKIETCEKCGGSVERQISGAPLFILKGSGWYKDGYK
jgi:putative FmdB family regulatory protein